MIAPALPQARQGPIDNAAEPKIPVAPRGAAPQACSPAERVQGTKAEIIPPEPSTKATLRGTRELGSNCAILDFTNAPYPVGHDLRIPETNERFFQKDSAGRWFHLAPRGGRLLEPATYRDRRSLLVLPQWFNPKTAVLILFFHGNGATLRYDVILRQRVVEQFERSGVNAVLVAPQLAVNALDSSPGRFYERHFFDRYVSEAAIHLAQMSGGKFTPQAFDALPIIIAAYSGGYLATAYSLPAQSGTSRRIAGVILLDALFGEEPKIATWVTANRDRAFFVSAYSASSAVLNGKIEMDLKLGKIAPARSLPPALRGGVHVLHSDLGIPHNDFVTGAMGGLPLLKILQRVASSEPAAAIHPEARGAVVRDGEASAPKPSSRDSREKAGGPAATTPSQCPVDSPKCSGTKPANGSGSKFGEDPATSQ